MKDIIFSDIKSIGKKDVPYSADDFAVGGAVRNSPMVSANSFFPDKNLLWIGSDGIIYKNGKDKNKTGRWVKTKIKAEAIKVNYQGVDYYTFVNPFNSLSTSGTDIIPLVLVTNDGVVNYTQANNLVYVGIVVGLSITAVETAIEIGFIKKGWLKMSKSAKKTATKTPKPTTKLTPINPHKVWIEGTPLLTQQAIVIELEKRGFTLSKNKYLQPKEGRTGLGVTEERNIVFTSLEKKEFNSGRSLYGTELGLQELLDLFPILTLTSTKSAPTPKPTKKDVTIPNSDLKIGDVVEITEKSSVDFGTVTNIKGFEETYGVLLFYLSGIEDEDGESIGFTRDMLKLRDKLRKSTKKEKDALKLVNNSQNKFILSDDNDKELQDISDLLEYFDGTTDVSKRKKLYEEADKIIKKRYGNEQRDNAEFGVNNRKNLITPINLLDYYFTQTTQSPVASVQEPCGLPTPNGKKSKLPLQTYLAVRTPYFKRWFGDWVKAYDTGEYADCSLVIDKDTKEPRIMYHGVRKFIKGYGSFANMGQGVTRPYGSFEPPKFPASYFGDNLNYIEFYGGNAKNMRKPSPEYKGFYYNVFLNMRNPIRLDLLGFEASYTDFIDFMFVKYGIEVTPDPQLVPKVGMTKKNKIWVYVRNGAGMIKLLKDNGYDGIVQLGDVPQFDKSGNIISEPLIDREYLTFYANQVKSANVRNSFYLGFFNDIRFKDGGNVSI